MNKFTKLLSVFAIAGLVGAGTAAIAGCNSHEHEGVKHDAVAATCTTAGNTEYYTCSGEEGKYYSDKECTKEITLEETVVNATGHAGHKHDAKTPNCTETGNSVYYTCDNECCADKYFTDEACTTETTLAAVTIAANGHSNKYAPKDNANHTVTCNNCNVAATDQAHVDADGDGVCDSCSTTFFAGAYYYNSGSTLITVTFKADGKVGVKIATIDTIESADEATGTVTIEEKDGVLSTTFEDDTYSYTIEKKDGAYTLKYKNVGGGSLKTRALTAIPETYFDAVNAVTDFAGVYEVEGGHVFYSNLDERYYKLSSVMINEEAKIYLTYVWVNADGSAKEGTYPITKEIDASDTKVLYSTFKVDEIKISAKDANLSQIEVTIGNANETDSFVVTPVVMTKSATKQPAVVSSDMGIAANTKFVGTNHTFKVVGEVHLYDDGTANIVGGDATNGYVITVYDTDYCEISYLVKVSTDGNTITVYQTDGTTLIDTLTKTDVAYTKLTTCSITDISPKYNDTSALVADDFNESFKCYEIPTTGWYYFKGMTGTSDSAGATTVTLYPYADHKADSDNKIVTNYTLPNKGVKFNEGDLVAISAYADDFYLVAICAEANMDKMLFEDFEEFDQSVYGTYSYSYSSWGESVTVNYVINEDGISYYNDYGYYVDNPIKLTVSVVSGGSYVVNFYGNTLVFTFNLEGNISVMFDGINYIDGRYEAIKGGSGGEDNDEVQYAVAGENTLTISALGEGEVVLNKKGEWKITFGEGVNRIWDGENFVTDGGTIEITDTAKTLTVMSNNTTAKFTLTLVSGTGEEIEEGGASSSATLSVGTNTISSFDSETYTATVTFTATEDGDYKFDFEKIDNSIGYETTVNDEALTVNGNETATTTLNLLAGDVVTIVVYQDVAGNDAIITITKIEAPKAVAGENTVEITNGTEVDVIINLVGTWKITYGENINYVMIGRITVANDGTFEVTDEEVELRIIGNAAGTAKFTLTLVSGSGEEIGGDDEGGETPSSNALSIGSNTITSFSGSGEGTNADLTFTATEAGDYTFTFTNVYEATYSGKYAEVNGITATGSFTLTFTAGETKTINVVPYNYEDPTMTVTVAKSAGNSSEEGGESGAFNGALSVGSNTIAITDYDSDLEGNAYKEVTFTATEAGDYTFTFNNAYNVIYGNEQYVEVDGMTAIGTVTLTFTAGQTESIRIEINSSTQETNVYVEKA